MTTESLTKTLRFLKSFETRPSEVSPALPRNLKSWKVEGEQTWIVQNFGVAWLVVYNGGEIMLHEINDPYSTPSAVPTEWFGEPLNEATIAARIAMVLRGETIDYNYRLTDEDQEAFETARY